MINTESYLYLPRFETQRLILRHVTEEDFSEYSKNFVDYEVIRYLSSAVPWPYPENGVSEFYKNVIWPNQGISRWTWGVFKKESANEVIGAVDLWREGCPENRGFWLAKKYWGQGIMSEAVEPVMDYAFNHLEFDKLTFANAVGNFRSRRIKEKTGAKFIGIEPAQFVDSQFTEHEIWELDKNNWLATRDSDKYLVSEDYEICYPKPLNLKIGDSIQLEVKEVPPKWYGWNWCKDKSGNEGWISQSYIKKVENGFEVVKNYTAKELSVQKGELVNQLFEDCGWAWCVNENLEEGWLPKEILVSGEYEKDS